MREKNDRYEALLKGALARIEELEQEVARARSGAGGREPVAIVGMGCRFPGAGSPEAYWRLLAEGRDAITEVPADRWDVDAYYDPDPDAPGRMSTRHGGFLDDLTGFDAALFGISAREAASVDPQQRLLMEVSWEAFEDAGMPVKSLPARTGVFVGISNVDYREAMVAQGADALDGYFSSGSTTSTASGRLSYFLGLTGPSLSVDTACSSSLVSLHLAVMNLRSGACDVALAGGVNQIVTPHETISLSKARMMAPDGRCKPFDAAADGYVRAEGCGMIVLKRLADARRDGDRVLAVIRGSATNQDGHRSGLTVPHGPSQQDVIWQALRDAGAEPHEIGYVEAHGTGTALGDPIEAAALGAVFAGRTRPLAIGSVKSNLGHLEAAAGVAGVIKAVLALRAGALPPTLHLDHPSPLIDWDALPLKVPTALEPWHEERRLAGVSSFGFSGTNCHVVLEGPGPEDTAVTDAEPSADGTAHVLTVSGATPAALDEAAARTAAFVADGAGGASLADVCLTAGTGRSHLEHRRAVVADSAAELVRGLTDGGPGTFDGQVRGARSVPEVAFLFTGQGSQYPDMGRELYETQPVFRRSLDECARILDPILGRPLTTLLYPDPANADTAAEELRNTRFTQPALFAVEYALARLWRSWGIEPVAVLGHSVGEYTAACVAGVFSLADGLRLVAERARLMQELPAGGVMVALRGRPDLVEDVVRRHPLVSVAAVNGPEDVVVSGDEAQVREAVAELGRHGVTGRDLRVSHAFHSPLMEPVTAPLTAAARSVRFSAPRIPVISNVTGGPVGAEELRDPGYWARHALAPVRFADGLRALRASGARAFVEIGPRPVLLGLGRGALPDADALWLPSLRPGRDSSELLGSLATLHVHGVPVDWAAFHQGRRPAGRRVALPTYPFQHERHWFSEESRPTAPVRSTAAGAPAEWVEWLVGVEWSEVAGEVVGPGLSGRWCVVDGSGGSGGFGGSGLVDLGPGVSLVGDVAEAEHVVFVASAGDVVMDGGLSAGADDASRALSLSVGLLGLVQRLAACAVPPRLYVVTRLGQVVRGLERPDPAQGALWGLVRTVHAEHPELRCVVVDGDGATPLERLLRTELPYSAVRGARRLRPELTPAAHLVPDSPAAKPAVRLSSGSAYLVTGGLGGLGLVVARRLAAEGAGHVVLAGRGAGEPSAGVRAAVGEMEALGARVHLVVADVSVPGEVGRLVDRVCAVAPLRGVVHAAGVLDDGVLGAQSGERFGRVFGPKVVGAGELDRVIRDRKVPLDFFVAFSSVAALVPTLGTGGYGAANAFLDVLMARRRADGLPGLAVNWGPWAEVGMAARDSADHEKTGLRPIPADSGARVAVRLARAAPATAGVAVVPADWAAFRSLLGDTLPEGYLDRLAGPAAGSPATPVGAGRTGAASGAADGSPSLRAELAAVRDPHALLAERVELMLRRVLGSRQPVGRHQGFASLGMDSLMAVEFRARLSDALELKLPTTLAFTHPNLDDLVPFLAQQLALPSAEPAEDPAGDVEQEGSGATASADTSASELMARISEKYRSHRRA